jgi:hypothetical protein
MNTFAPPLNEPIHKSKPRLVSQRPAQPGVQPPVSTQASSTSLLDEDNEDDLLGGMDVPSSRIMQPMPSSSKPASPLPPDGSPKGKGLKSKTSLKEDDVWNW